MKRSIWLPLVFCFSHSALAAHPSAKALLHSRAHKPYDVHQLQGVSVTTSPYLGVQAHFDGSDALVNIPSINEDLRILQYRREAERVLTKKGFSGLQHPHVKLSGKIEGAFSSVGSFTAARSSDIDLANAELDLMVDASDFATGYLALKYDNSAFPGVIRSSRTGNARVFLDKGFISFGRLAHCPLYATVGQFHMPFGRYASAMNSAPLPMLIGRIKARALLLGYAQQDGKGLQGSIYAYRGDTTVGGVSKVNEGGFNIDYVYERGKGHIKAGISATSNLAEAENMQSSGGAFPGFSNSAAFQTIAHRVPALDAHLVAGYGNFSAIAEYLRATRAFAVNDLSYLGQGAKPAAFNVEAGYNFNIANKPANVALGFGHTRQASALGVAKNRVGVVLNASLYRNTIETLEFNHAVNYPTTVSMGSNGQTFAVTGAGTANSVIAQVGIYF